MARYIHRTPVRDAVGEAYTAKMGEYVSQLAKLGYEAIMYAYRDGHASGSAEKKPVGDGKWRHRSRNLHDSFASAVYVNGILQEDSIYYIGGEYSRSEYGGMTGREYARQYLEDPAEDVSGDIALLCIAAMPYAEYLEEGTHKGGYKIRVISGAADYIAANWHRVKTDLFEIKKVRFIAGE